MTNPVLIPTVLRSRDAATTPDIDPFGRTGWKGERGGSYQTYVMWTLVILGIVLRIRQYAWRGSLWTDEARTSLDIQHLGFAALLHPLPLLQGAPWGYLWAERASFLAFGSNEYSLRLVSFIAGVAAVLLFRVLARRVLPGWSACLALGLVAVSPTLVQYSSQVKPYSDDVAVSILVLLVGLRALDEDSAARRWTWAIVAAAGVMFSFASLFPALAVAILMVWQGLRRRKPVIVLHVAAGSLLWSAFFLLQYFLSLRPIADTPFMRAFWASGYDPHPSSFSSSIHWLTRELESVARDPLGLTPAWLVGILTIIGLAAMVRRRPWAASALAVLVVMVIVAGIAGRYPLYGRTDIFLIPIVALAACGATTIGGVGAGRMWLIRLAATGLVLSIAASSLVAAAGDTVHPPVITAFRQAYLFARHHATPPTPIYINDEAAAVFVYYRPILHLHPQGSLNLTNLDSCQGTEEWSQLGATPRFWVVFGIPFGIHPTVGNYLHTLATIGRVHYHATSFGAGAALVEVDPTRLRAALERPRGPCLRIGALPTFASLKRSLDNGRI